MNLIIVWDRPFFFLGSCELIHIFVCKEEIVHWLCWKY